MKFTGKKELTAGLKVKEKVFRDVGQEFPILWPEYYFNLIKGDPFIHPVARMGAPKPEELMDFSGDLTDPVADIHSRIDKFLVQKHADRIIVLTTKRCHFYCRFCFRRDEGVKGVREVSRDDWNQIFHRIRSSPEISEVILSGGDPLTLSDERLQWIIKNLESIPSLKKLRIHSRAPVHCPERITPELIECLKCKLNLTLVVHFNHPVEVTQEVLQALLFFENGNIIIKNQTVLLAGVNDCPFVLAALNKKLVANRVKPYYLHHPDRVKGNNSYRLSIVRGINIYRTLQKLAEGDEPEYVLDLPDGTGKVPVLSLEGIEPDCYRFKHLNGDVSIYQDLAPLSIYKPVPV